MIFNGLSLDNISNDEIYTHVWEINGCRKRYLISLKVVLVTETNSPTKYHSDFEMMN